MRQAVEANPELVAGSLGPCPPELALAYHVDVKKTVPLAVWRGTVAELGAKIVSAQRGEYETRRYADGTEEQLRPHVTAGITAPDPERPGKRLGRKDRHTESIGWLFVDCDGAGKWNRLRDWCAEHELAAIFSQSKSRKEDRWHALIPLVEPFLFQATPGPRAGERTGAGAGAQRAYKRKHNALVAVVSALAGMPGVGGKCGLDLATDALAQPDYLALRRPGMLDPPARVEILDGPNALDVDALLAAVGYDDHACRAVVSPPRRAPPKSTRGPWTGSGAENAECWARLAAFTEAGWIVARGQNGWAMRCPNHASHTIKEGTENNAILFPSGWVSCKHNGCRAKGARLGDMAMADLPPSARKKYELRKAIGGSRQGESVEIVAFPGVWEITPDATRAWIEAQVERGIDEPQLSQRTASVLVRLGLEPEAVISATTAGATEAKIARSQAERLSSRHAEGRAIKGVAALRDLVGTRAMAELAEAIRRDGLTSSPAIAFCTTQGRLRDHECQWLRGVWGRAGDVPYCQKIVRGAGCMKITERQYAHGEHVRDSIRVCEDTSCGWCFGSRVKTEIRLLDEGDPESDFREWTEGSYFVATFKGLTQPLVAELGEALSRYPSGWVRVLGRDQDGITAVVVATSDVLQVKSACYVFSRYLKRAHPGGSYTRAYLEKRQVLRLLTTTRLSLHVHLRSLIEAQDEEGLKAFLAWAHGRPMFKSSKLCALTYPSRAQVREAYAGEQDDDEINLLDLEPEDRLYEYVDTRFSDLVLVSSQYPIPPSRLGELWAKTRDRVAYHEVLTYLADPPPEEMERQEEEAFRRRQRRINATEPI